MPLVCSMALVRLALLTLGLLRAAKYAATSVLRSSSALDAIRSAWVRPRRLLRNPVTNREPTTRALYDPYSMACSISRRTSVRPVHATRQVPGLLHRRTRRRATGEPQCAEPWPAGHHC